MDLKSHSQGPEKKPIQQQAKLELEAVPRILKQLTRVNGSRQDKHGARRFAGQVAVEEGMVNRQQLNDRLLAQAIEKSAAAERDLEIIGHYGKQEHADWLAPNWGNVGVNKATNLPSVPVAAAAAAANIAQNIVLLINEHSSWMARDHGIKMGVRAASRLVQFIAGAEHLMHKEAGSLRDSLMSALRRVAKDIALYDNQRPPQRINLEYFIMERQKEINQCIEEHNKN